MLPLFASAALIGLVVVLLPFLGLESRAPRPLATPAPAATVPPAPVTSPPPPAAMTPAPHSEPPVAEPPLAGPPVAEPPVASAPAPAEAAPPPPASVRIEPATDGVTLVVEHREPRVSERVTVHTVVRGDTLWDIADHYLNDPWSYARLAEDSAIRDPDIIQVGDKVRIVER